MQQNSHRNNLCPLIWKYLYIDAIYMVVSRPSDEGNFGTNPLNNISSSNVSFEHTWI